MTLSEFQMAITSERLHKQSVVIKQICKLFAQRRVSASVLIDMLLFAIHIIFMICKLLRFNQKQRIILANQICR